ncbi:ABC transporter substrate-binding protein [Geodermatophilus sabuli]|uniref:Putative spermidine/putrescine transport system substrate-binding protein n=1 Tax=Geodermatophilus sabuli TaxID=1564158 RepID=A0A285EJL5_9ACTN|nr:extracellular solute-binding protein [Geodermatophilus sabuli]MBB3085894.1 putative spermidine/putrescine transport system substrate-binding protein [Geodermatophilus sabuli]SNX98236.1 putative spermidine/putrescine transport system substrate-binding protein [Geodermatophilus sabuli]
MQCSAPSRRPTVRAAATLAAALVLAACGGGDEGSGGGGSDSGAATATSLQDVGDLDALVEAAQAEGTLNVIALPPDWANYGEMIETFTEKYGIEVVSALPDGSSQDELNAVTSQRGQDRAPDVLDLGTPFHHQAKAQDLLAPYQVQTWDEIPEGQKDPEGYWVNDYGGYVSIGCNASVVGQCPTTFAELLDPQYAGLVALNGNPTQATAAFSGVWAASLANGGDLDDIGPGVDFFRQVKDAGNWNPVEITPATILSGETPISIDWDYNNAALTDDLVDQGAQWQVAVPSDGLFGGYYNQAISRFAPHPAAARLWQEFLYSDEGQNIWLRGGARPVRLPAMEEAGTADADALSALPPVEGTAEFPSQEQETAARDVVAERWNAEMSG